MAQRSWSSPIAAYSYSAESQPAAPAVTNRVGMMTYGAWSIMRAVKHAR